MRTAEFKEAEGVERLIGAKMGYCEKSKERKTELDGLLQRDYEHEEAKKRVIRNHLIVR